MPRLQTLEAIEGAVWAQLAEAARDRGHAWRTPVLATSTAAGDPQARTVVLRETDVPARQLLFFTDHRSPKATQIRDRSRGVLVMWSPLLGWQLRIDAALEMQVDGLAVSSRWALMKLSPSAHDYLSPLPPGSEIAPDTPSAGLLAREDDRGHFALVTATVRCIDWLELHAEGHRRARFEPDGAHWLQP